MVVQDSPQLNEAKIALMDLLKKNDIEQAFAVVESAEDLILQVKKAQLYAELKNFDEFLKICLPIVKTINKQVASIRFGRGPNVPPKDSWESVVAQLGPDDAFDLIILVANALTNEKRIKEAIEVLKMAMDSKRITEDSQINELRNKYIDLTFSSKEYDSSCDALRQIILDDLSNIEHWNLFNSIMSFTENFTSNQKFLTRIYLKNPENLPATMILANLHSVRGTYRVSLAMYLSLFRKIPTDPLINLCVGITFLTLSTSRRCANRHQMVLCGFSFLSNYFEKRQDYEEINYNLGRAYQSLSLFHLAIPHYEKVLLEDGQLKYEAAFNLSLIYKQSGNFTKAGLIINEYLVI
jgi:general transcription factor 3C polypeptide 3 (transcription factor C subunit 4)